MRNITWGFVVMFWAHKAPLKPGWGPAAMNHIPFREENGVIKHFQQTTWKNSWINKTKYLKVSSLFSLTWPWFFYVWVYKSNYSSNTTANINIWNHIDHSFPFSGLVGKYHRTAALLPSGPSLSSSVLTSSIHQWPTSFQIPSLLLQFRHTQ